MPAVVAQRISELLQTFPSAAMGGIQWQTLVRKYEERHGTRLNIAELGHDTAVGAATALLWDVLRMVETEDTDNPVVALEDSIALTPQPRMLASWPSLYQALCRLTLESGAAHKDEGLAEGARGILVSKLKPLLQEHWHSGFDEAGLSYLTDQGTSVQLKKMKHLLSGVLRWRDQRMTWQAEAGIRPGAVEEAIRDRLELTRSNRYNDLLLVCIPATAGPQPLPEPLPPLEPMGHCVKSLDQEPSPLRLGGKAWADQVDSDDDDQTTQVAESPRSSEVAESPRSSETGSSSSEELVREVARLRAENNDLRFKNEILGCHAAGIPLGYALTASPDVLELPGEVFDNPFEPPPELPRSASFSSGSATPSSQALGSHAGSGVATPLAMGSGGGQVCTIMGILYSFGDRAQIRNGVVAQACRFFEHSGKGSIPNFFQQ